MKKITSLSNPLIKKYIKLKQKKYRDQEKLFLIEGNHLIDEASKHNVLVDVLTSNQNKKGIFVSKLIIKKLANSKTPQDLIGVCKIKQQNVCGRRILALDNIQDPGNLGTLIRTARAFNWDGIIYSGVNLYNDKVIRSSQGALFSISIIQVNDIKSYFKNYEVFAATLNKKAMPYNKFKHPRNLMLVLGNESNGIREDIIKDIKNRIYIPIAFESLNVAQAGAILLNEFKK